MPSLPAYAELRCLSNFTFLRGASHPQELIERALALIAAALPAAGTHRAGREWGKDDLDTLGLLKVAVLVLGMLSAMRRALDLVNGHRGSALAMEEINGYGMTQKTNAPPGWVRRLFLWVPDDVLLSHGIHRTIIGAEAFHGPVRNGKGWDHLAMFVRRSL